MANICQLYSADDFLPATPKVPNVSRRLCPTSPTISVRVRNRCRHSRPSLSRRRSTYRACTGAPIRAGPGDVGRRAAGLRLSPRRPSERRTAGRKMPPVHAPAPRGHHVVGHGGSGPGAALAALGRRPAGRRQSTLWPQPAAAGRRGPTPGAGSNAGRCHEPGGRGRGPNPQNPAGRGRNHRQSLVARAADRQAGRRGSRGGSPAAGRQHAGRPAGLSPAGAGGRPGRGEPDQIHERPRRRIARTAVRSRRDLAARARGSIDLGTESRARSTAGWRTGYRNPGSTDPACER